MAHRRFVQVTVDGLAQRLGIEPAGAQGVHQKLPQFLPGLAFRHGQDAPVVQTFPQLGGGVLLSRHKQGGIETSHAGAGDDLRGPAQLQQGLIHPHLIAALCAAARKHKAAHGLIFFGHRIRLLPVCRFFFIISSDPQNCHCFLGFFDPPGGVFVQMLATVPKKEYDKND